MQQVFAFRRLMHRSVVFRNMGQNWTGANERVGNPSLNTTPGGTSVDVLTEDFYPLRAFCALAFIAQPPAANPRPATAEATSPAGAGFFRYPLATSRTGAEPHPVCPPSWPAISASWPAQESSAPVGPGPCPCDATATARWWKHLSQILFN